MNAQIYSFVDFVKGLSGKIDKPNLVLEIQKKFGLTKDRSVLYNENFAVRISSSKTNSFSNTVISLSALQKYDDSPFIVCLVTPTRNILYLANTSFLKKVSHSSHELRANNIKGSINGSDIEKRFNDEIENSPENFDKLFAIHSEIGFSGNLERLVESTNGITPTGKRFSPKSEELNLIMHSPERALNFIDSQDYHVLKSELDEKVEKYKDDIIIASFIDNVNVRGRVIEYIIAGKDDKLRSELIKALKQNGVRKLPNFRTDDGLGDYDKIFEKYKTATDIKTKVMLLHSMPKAYNIDKMLEFLSSPKSVFMFYFIGIEPEKIANNVLISIFQDDLRNTTNILKHWAGRNSRGVTQFDGNVLNALIKKPNNNIDVNSSKEFLKKLLKI